MLQCNVHLICHNLETLHYKQNFTIKYQKNRGGVSQKVGLCWGWVRAVCENHSKRHYFFIIIIFFFFSFSSIAESSRIYSVLIRSPYWTYSAIIQPYETRIFLAAGVNVVWIGGKNEVYMEATSTYGWAIGLRWTPVCTAKLLTSFRDMRVLI